MAEDEELESGGGASGRSLWTGTITFGLVSVPVSLFPATRPRTVALKMVDTGGAPVERHYVCSKDEQELDNDDIVRGYEIEKGKFVVVTDDELEAIEPRKTREIDLQLFVDRDDIPPIYFERAYFLTPAGGSNKAYRLLAEVMEQSGKAGIATFVMRAKEYLVAILAENGILRAETLRFADEIRTPGSVGLPKQAKPKPAEVRRFEEAIRKHEGKVDFAEFLNDYAERLEDLVDKKQKKGEDVVKAPKEASREEEGAEVIDLLEVLRRSLGNEEPPRRARKPATRKRPAARKRTSTKKSAAKRKAK